MVVFTSSRDQGHPTPPNVWAFSRFASVLPSRSSLFALDLTMSRFYFKLTSGISTCSSSVLEVCLYMPVASMATLAPACSRSKHFEIGVAHARWLEDCAVRIDGGDCRIAIADAHTDAFGLSNHGLHRGECTDVPGADSVGASPGLTKGKPHSVAEISTETRVGTT